MEQSNFKRAMSAIAVMTHDQLRDALDYVQIVIMQESGHEIRTGLVSIRDVTEDGTYDSKAVSEYAQECAAYRLRSSNQYQQAQYKHRVEECIRAFNALPKAQQNQLYQIGRLRQQDTAPVAKRRIAWSDDGNPQAKGSIRTKKIRGVNYLYYTYYLSGGDRDRRTKRVKSEYVGHSELAEWIQEQLPHADADKRPLRRAVLHHLRDLYLRDPALLEDFDVEAFVEHQRSKEE